MKRIMKIVIEDENCKKSYEIKPIENYDEKTSCKLIL